MDSIIFFFTTPPLLVQALVNGIAIGGLFALAAYGLALVWGVMNIINVSQGEFVIMGGYVTYFLTQQSIVPMHPLVTIPFSALFLFFIGVFFYNFVISKLVDRDLFTSLLATFGLSILLQQLMNVVFGADIRLVETNLGTTFFMDELVSLPNSRSFAFVFSLAVAGVLVLFMKKSKMGRAIRATAQNAQAARVLGVPTDKVYRFTFALNAAICGAAGSLVALTFAIHPYIGLPYTIRSFMIVIFAGLGNLPGVVFSAATLGVIEESADFMFGAEFRMAVVFGLLVVILVLRNWLLGLKREYLS